MACGLGPAGERYLTAEVVARLSSGIPVVLRTRRHPAASACPAAESCDDLYEAGATFDGVYGAIVERVVERAREHGDVTYAVPGSPTVLERSVALLRGDGRVDVDVWPAVSFLDLAWAALGVDPVEESALLVDAYQFAVQAAGRPGPFLVAHAHSADLLSDVKLALGDEPAGGTPVTVLQRLGSPDQAVFEVPWAELDREVVPDHLTSLWIPELAAPVAGEVQRFVELVRRLRVECPWDRQQTHQSLTRHLLEESYEVVEAIDRLDRADGTGDDELTEELGDLLFQVVFHATLGAERGAFDLADVTRTVHEKLVRRHPHVFGTERADTAGEVLANWEEIKRVEKGRGSVMDGLPALPSMLLAVKVQKKAASAGLDFADSAEVRAVVDDELAELDAAVTPGDREAEIGDVLAAAISVARLEGLDPDRALRMWAERFVDRFREVESQAAAEGVDIAGADRATLDRWWATAKRRLAGERAHAAERQLPGA